MNSQVRMPHPKGCFLAKVEQIYGPGVVKKLNAAAVCWTPCSQTQPFTVMLAVLLHLAPRSHGWKKWTDSISPPADYIRLENWGDNEAARTALRHYVSIAPRPRSYTKWNSLLGLIGEETGGVGECVRCRQQKPLIDMIHRGSDQGMSHVAGLVCTSCNDLINAGHQRW